MEQVRKHALTWLSWRAEEHQARGSVPSQTSASREWVTGAQWAQDRDLPTVTATTVAADAVAPHPRLPPLRQAEHRLCAGCSELWLRCAPWSRAVPWCPTYYFASFPGSLPLGFQNCSHPSSGNSWAPASWDTALSQGPFQKFSAPCGCLCHSSSHPAWCGASMSLVVCFLLVSRSSEAWALFY